MAAALVAVFVLFPGLSEDRVLYFTSTLDPGASTNEWDTRAAMWLDNVERGARIGGVLGAGTGAGSLGLQYLAAEE